MIKKRFINISALAIIVVLLYSCVKDVDFDQARDLSISPVFESSLLFFNEPASKFFVNNNEIVTIQDSVTIDLFNRDFIVDNLVKAEFIFETTNSINATFKIGVDFLNITDQVQHSFEIISLASPLNTDVISEHIEVFEGNSLTALKATNKIVLSIGVSTDDAMLNEDSPGRIELKSKGIFYLEIKTAE